MKPLQEFDGTVTRSVNGIVKLPVVALEAAVTNKVRPVAPTFCGNAGEVVTPVGKLPAFTETVPLKLFREVVLT